MNFFVKLGKFMSDIWHYITLPPKNKFKNLKFKNNIILEKEEAISKLFLSLGQSYYEKHKNDKSTEEPEIIAEINSLYFEIVQICDNLQNTNESVKCIKCGTNIPGSSNFCYSCGAKLNHAEYSNKEQLCKICHSTVKNDDLFCTHCGSKIN